MRFASEPTDHGPQRTSAKPRTGKRSNSQGIDRIDGGRLVLQGGRSHSLDDWPSSQRVIDAQNTACEIAAVNRLQRKSIFDAAIRNCQMADTARNEWLAVLWHHDLPVFLQSKMAYKTYPGEWLGVASFVRALRLHVA